MTMRRTKAAAVERSEEIVRGRTRFLLFVSLTGARLPLDQNVLENTMFSSGYRSDSSLDTPYALAYLNHRLSLFKLPKDYQVQIDALGKLALRLLRR